MAGYGPFSVAQIGIECMTLYLLPFINPSKETMRHADRLSTVGANTRFAPTGRTIAGSMIYFLGRRTTDSGMSRGGVDIGIDRSAGTSCPVVGHINCDG